jgi:hypothetical protein
VASLLGVYRDREEAEATARDLVERASIPPETLHVGERADYERSIRAEMDAETVESVGSPGLGAFMTKEMFRGASIFALVLGGAGVVVGALLGMVYSGASGWSTGDRVLLGIVIGALFFGTVGTLLGGGLAMKSPEDRLAAEHGVPVRVDDISPDARDIMSEHHPIRLDRLADTRRLETLETEGSQGLAETTSQFIANSADPRRQG